MKQEKQVLSKKKGIEFYTLLTTTYPATKFFIKNSYENTIFTTITAQGNVTKIMKMITDNAF